MVLISQPNQRCLQETLMQAVLGGRSLFYLQANKVGRSVASSRISPWLPFIKEKKANLNGRCTDQLAG